MKKLIILALALFTYQKWDTINLYLDPPPDYAALHNGDVILYSTDWCGYCKKTRTLLEAHGIDYYEYDIDKSIEGREQYTRLGGNGVPVMLIDNEVIKGYAPDIIEAFSKSKTLTYND